MYGDLYVLIVGSALNSYISVYDTSVSGKLPLKRSIAGSTTQIGAPQDIAVDPSGNLYVTRPAEVYRLAVEISAWCGRLGPVFPAFIALNILN